MGMNSLLYCAAIGILIIAAPYMLFSKSAVKEYVTSQKTKKIGIALILLFLCFIVWFGVVKIPWIVNRLYVTQEGTVKEILGSAPVGGMLESITPEYIKDAKLTSYDISLQDSDCRIVSVCAEKLKKNDEIELKKFANTAIVTKRNGKETDFYKAHYEEWVGFPFADRIVLTLIILVNMFIHMVKFGFKVKQNLGCAAFNIVMFISTWKPIDTIREAVCWGVLLAAIFIGYQINDSCYRIKEPGYINIPYPEIKGIYAEISESEKIDLLKQKKDIDYICPNCGGKMVLSDDHKHKRCDYCGSVIQLSGEERANVGEILHVMNVPKADCVEIIKKICASYRPEDNEFERYLAGESLCTTGAGVCEMIKGYFKIPDEEDIFFIYDYSWSGSAKYGFVICTNGIYFHQGWFKKPGMYSWEEYKKIQIFANNGNMHMGRVLFWEEECQSLGKMLQKIQHEI